MFFFSLLSQARLQRANVRLKQGKLEEARADYKEIVSTFLRCTEISKFVMSILPPDTVHSMAPCVLATGISHPTNGQMNGA